MIAASGHTRRRHTRTIDELELMCWADRRLRIEVAGDLAIVRVGGCEFVAAVEAVAGS